MDGEPAKRRLVKSSLIPSTETAVPVAPTSPMTGARRHVLPRRHRLMLLLAFEVLIFGAAQAVFSPIQRPGILVEQTVTPNHVMT